jgi:hypothetical protein
MNRTIHPAGSSYALFYSGLFLFRIIRDYFGMIWIIRDYLGMISGLLRMILGAPPDRGALQRHKGGVNIAHKEGLILRTKRGAGSLERGLVL